MSDITELERRITAALDRIGVSLDSAQSGVSTPDTATLARLDAAEAKIAELEQALSAAQDDLSQARQDLEDEKTVSAQAEERIKAIRDKADRHTSAMDIQVFEHQQATANLDGDLQRLRRAAEDLRASNMQLREALTQGVAEPHLINKAMLAELETLRATRAVEIAQADAVLASLEPLARRAARDAQDSQDSKEPQNA